MPQPGITEVITGKEGRPYLQVGGPRPNNRVLYYGGETNYLEVTGVTEPQLGGITPIRAHSPNDIGQYAFVGASLAGQDFPKATVTMHEKTGAVPRHLLGINDLLNVYLVHGRSRSLSDFDYGWEDYVEVYAGGRITDRSPGDRFSMDKDDALMTALTVVWTGGSYPVGSLVFGEKNKTAVTLEMLDACYGDKTTYAQYGPANDGTQWIYMVEKGGAAAKPIVHYSLDGGATWTTSSVSVAANAEAPSNIRVMGSYLVVLSPTANSSTQGGYYYAVINPVSGAPGAWTKVTTGFSNNQQPRDMVVLGPREAYICADAGEILKLIDVTAGPTSLGIQTSNNLARIAGNGDAIVAVGASATVLRSTNRGATWAVTTNAPGSADLTAVEVRDRNRVWAGNGSGALYYTLTGGETAWVNPILPATVAAIQDIRFPTDEAGYVAYTISGTLGRIAGTINGGVSWVTSDVTNPRVLGVPATVNQRYNRLAIPHVLNASIDANNVIAVGLGATTDGAVQQAVANVF